MIHIGECARPLSEAEEVKKARTASVVKGSQVLGTAEVSGISKISIGANKEASCWSLYLLRREDGGLYTGISTDVARRFEEHLSGRGSRSLRGKVLIGIEYSLAIGTRSLASRAEYRVKQLAKEAKESLIRNSYSREELLTILELKVD